MKFLIQAGITIVLCFVFQTFLPWWTLAIGAFAGGYLIKNTGLISFAAGFFAAGLLWLAMAEYSTIMTHGILADRINKLLPVSPLLMTTLIGALVGGFGGLTGASMRSVGRSFS